jgi:predicted permease
VAAVRDGRGRRVAGDTGSAVKLLPDGWRRLLRVWRRSPTRDVDAELAFHFDERIAELVAGGMAANEARRVAAGEFGDVEAVRTDLVNIDTRTARHRDLREHWDGVIQDFGFVLRSLRRAPGFLTMVSLTLALGIGVNAAIFSLLDRLFLSPPPGIAHSNDVRRIYRVNPPEASAKARRAGVMVPAGPTTQSFFDYPQVEELQAVRPPGTVIAGYSWDNFIVGRGADAVSVSGTYVLGDYFGVLGVHPELGRFFSAAETRIDAADQVAIIGEHLWQAQFSGRRGVVGQPIDLNGHRYTIIGVVAGLFHGTDNDASDVWVPMGAMRWQNDGDPSWYRPKGGGRTLIIRLFALIQGPRQANAMEQAATGAFRYDAFRPDSLASARLGSLIEASWPDADDRNVTVATRLAGLSIIILLIACANVANLLLARGLRRRREIAVRLALGLSRRRLIRLLLAESVTVAAIGSVIALGVALWAGTALRHVLLPNVNWVDAPLNLHVLLFTVLLAMCVGIGAGIVPALQASRPDLAVSLKAGARDGVYRRSRVRTTLLVVQSALSVVLLASAGVFLRSLHSVETENIGYTADRIVYGSIRLDPNQKALAADIPVRLGALAERLRHLPGVDGVALAGNTPMRGTSFIKVTLPGSDSLPHVAARGPFVSFISPDFFSVVGMLVLGGRQFTADDRADDELTVVVNQTMARSLWPGQAALGECLVLDGHAGRCSRVIGVVSDARQQRIVEPPVMQFYLPLAPSRAGVVALRSAPGRAAIVAEEVKREMRSAVGVLGQPVVQRMTDNLADELRPWRTGAALFSVAGLLALLVAAVGVYSTISYTFSQRTHEIGVRMALGAGTLPMLRLVVLSGVRVVVAGIAIGVVLAWAAGALVQSMLYKTSAHDIKVMATASVTLLLVAIVACLVPAWRALRVDPAIALRAD